MSNRTDKTIEIAVVQFKPQESRGEHIYPAGDPVTFEVPAEDATNDRGELVEPDSYESDQLKEHENAPQAVQDHDGPFAISISEIRDVPVREPFKTDEIREVTDLVKEIVRLSGGGERQVLNELFEGLAECGIYEPQDRLIRFYRIDSATYEQLRDPANGAEPTARVGDTYIGATYRLE